MNELVKILLIDDDAAFKEIFEDQLKRADSSLHFSVDSVQGVDRHCSFDYDIYIVDHILFNRPASIDIITTIRQDHPEAVIFVLSGQGDFELLKQLSRLEITGFVDKNDENLSEIAEHVRHITAIKGKLRTISVKFASVGIA